MVSEERAVRAVGKGQLSVGQGKRCEYHLSAMRKHWRDFRPGNEHFKDIFGGLMENGLNL